MSSSSRLWRYFGITLLFTLTVITTVSGAMEARSLPEPTFATNLTSAIPLYSLPTTYPRSLRSQNPISENQIRDTLAHYPLAIDGKNFPALNLVFTQDVVANYPEPLGVLTGLSSVIPALQSTLAAVRTQHAFSTQLIEILEGESKARSLTYYTASHFGQGDYSGQVCHSGEIL